MLLSWPLPEYVGTYPLGRQSGDVRHRVDPLHGLLPPLVIRLPLDAVRAGDLCL